MLRIVCCYTFRFPYKITGFCTDKIQTISKIIMDMFGDLSRIHTRLHKTHTYNIKSTIPNCVSPKLYETLQKNDIVCAWEAVSITSLWTGKRAANNFFHTTFVTFSSIDRAMRVRKHLCGSAPRGVLRTSADHPRRRRRRIGIKCVAYGLFRIVFLF